MRRTLRSLPLLATLVALSLPAAPASAAQGGSASCTVPFEVGRAQSLGEMWLEKQPYELTVLDRSEIACREANEKLREALLEPGAEVPRGWKVDALSRVFSREDGSEAFRLTAAPDEAVSDDSGGSIWSGLESFALTWLPVIFMGLIAIA